MKANKHSNSIPAATLEQAKAKIEEVAELLKPYLLVIKQLRCLLIYRKCYYIFLVTLNLLVDVFLQ